MDNKHLSTPKKLSEHFWRNDMTPIVSVFCWSYNNKDFIKECIESILMQITNFQVEIIIHDDASNDGTREIINEYEHDYPQLFKNILHIENQWSQGKSVTDVIFKKPRGKYVALIHGDDYWIDPYKIQKQYEILEKNPNVSLVYSNALIYYEENNKFKNILKPTENFIIQFKDYLMNYTPIPTSTMVFRSSEEYKDQFNCFNFQKEDFILRFIFGNKGFFAYLNSKTAVYRKHKEGVSNKFDVINTNKESIRLNNELNIFFNYKYDFFLGKYDQQAYERIYFGYMQKRNIIKGFYYFLFAIKDKEKKILKLNRIWYIIKAGFKIFITKKCKF